MKHVIFILYIVYMPSIRIQESLNVNKGEHKQHWHSHSIVKLWNGGKSQGKNVKYNKALNSHISVFLFLIFANYKPEGAKSELPLCLLQ